MKRVKTKSKFLVENSYEGQKDANLLNYFKSDSASHSPVFFIPSGGSTPEKLSDMNSGKIKPNALLRDSTVSKRKKRKLLNGYVPPLSLDQTSQYTGLNQYGKKPKTILFSEDYEFLVDSKEASKVVSKVASAIASMVASKNPSGNNSNSMSRDEKVGEEGIEKAICPLMLFRKLADLKKGSSTDNDTDSVSYVENKIQYKLEL